MKKDNLKVAKIIIVDDHPVVASGIQQLIDREPDMKVIASAADAETALRLIEKDEPDVIVVDISLKGTTNGIELIKGIKKRYPKIKCIVLSMHDESLYAERAIKAGAKGYVMKNDLMDNIIKALRTVIKGNLYLSEEMTSRLIHNVVTKNSDDEYALVQTLSDREFELFRYISEGKKTADIAKMMNISIKTVEAHKLRIKTKLNIQNSAELTHYAIEWKHRRGQA